MINSRSTDNIVAAILAIVAWTGLAIQFYVTQTHPNLASVSALERTIRYFEYFTIFTNLLVALSLTISLVIPGGAMGRFFSRPSTKTAIALYIALVGIVYNVVLRGSYEFTGAAYVADFLTHNLVPILYIIYWLLIVKRGEVSWTMPFLWLVYPAAYVTFALVRGESTGRYPYPFLNVTDLGLAQVLVNTVVLTLVFFLFGALFVAVDKAIARVITQ